VTTPRRRLVRPPPIPSPSDPGRPRRLQRLRTSLEKERAALARWMTRLKRAFHVVERSLRNITRIERLIARLEDS
jgi:hypothetical protein